MFYFQTIPLIFLLFFSSLGLAQSIPLNNVSLRIVPRGQSDPLSTKVVHVNEKDNGLSVSWQSLVKEKDETAHYPTYKIKTYRGMIHTDGFSGKNVFFQPALWGNGYLQSDSASPLWLDPQVLSLKPKDRYPFNCGFLNVNKTLLKLAPPALYEAVLYLQNLYDQFVVGEDVKNAPQLKKNDVRGLKKFVQEFFFLKNLAKTKATLFVNQVKETYPARMVGNDYYQFVVIDDPLNPLVVSFKMFPENVPEFLRASFTTLKNHFEFHVAQVHY